MEMKFFILLVLLMVLAADSGVHGNRENLSKLRVKRSAFSAYVVTIAKGYIGSTNWAQASNMSICGISYQDQYKGHIFVADVFREAGVPASLGVPSIDPSCNNPIGPEEWANPFSQYLTESPCWTQVTDPAKGDVAAFDVQVGIVTGDQLTTSAAPDNVVENHSGFLPAIRDGPLHFWDVA